MFGAYGDTVESFTRRLLGVGSSHTRNPNEVSVLLIQNLWPPKSAS